ncbi:MAG: hypothetical protein FWG94_07080 [Oscillospiraceae bacterium]|nr:hypothetical protein [Oscillospiraceae bacterium]
MRKNELEKLERFLPENPNNYATLLGYYGYWYLTDKGSFEYPAVESAGDSESADSRTETDTQKYRMHTYEVYW